MLRGVDPLLSGELLQHLDQLGHGDVLALVDRNFPAYRYGRPVVELRGTDTAQAAQSLLSVFPLDLSVKHSIHRMQIDGEPDRVSTPTEALTRIASQMEGHDITIASVERFAFYTKAETAMLLVQTGETIPYSCYLLQKGVV